MFGFIVYMLQFCFYGFSVCRNVIWLCICVCFLCFFMGSFLKIRLSVLSYSGLFLCYFIIFLDTCMLFRERKREKWWIWVDGLWRGTGMSWGKENWSEHIVWNNYFKKNSLLISQHVPMVIGSLSKTWDLFSPSLSMLDMYFLAWTCTGLEQTPLLSLQPSTTSYVLNW